MNACTPFVSHFCPRLNASAVPTILMPNNILLHNLAACPMPMSPQCTILDPRASRMGFASLKFVFEPPTMNVNVPSLAAFTPTTLMHTVIFYFNNMIVINKQLIKILSNWIYYLYFNREVYCSRTVFISHKINLINKNTGERVRKFLVK